MTRPINSVTPPAQPLTTSQAVATLARALLSKIRGDIGESIDDENVKTLMLISVNLAEKLGPDAFRMIETFMSGDTKDETVLAENLTLRQVSDLLSIAHNLEARRKVAVARMLSACKDVALEVAVLALKMASVI